MKGKLACLLLLVMLLPLSAAPAAEYYPLPGAVHVYSTVSSGLYSMEDLVAMARKQKLKAIVLTDHSLVALEYGTFPFRNLMKKRVERNSVLKAGAEAYLNGISQINQKQTDVLVVPAIEAAPFYYWTGSLVNGNLTAHDYQKGLLVMGLPSAEDYQKLPLMHRGFSTRNVKALLPQGVILLLAFILGVYMIFQKNYLKITGLGITILSLALLINHHPFQSSRFDPYHGDQGIAPYQELIDYVRSRGGMVFWTNPESNYANTGKIGPVKAVTTPYIESLGEAVNYNGFSVLSEASAAVSQPGKKWDQLLNAYCLGERKEPAWGIAGVNFRGDVGGVKLDDFQTVFLVRNQTRKEILEALAKGRLYAKARGTAAGIALDEFHVADRATGGSALMGGELNLKSAPVITAVISADDGSARQVAARLIRSGEVLRTFEGVTPLKIQFEDQEFLSKKVYYRLDVDGGSAGRIVSNPIFVQKNAGLAVTEKAPEPVVAKSPQAAKQNGPESEVGDTGKRSERVKAPTAPVSAGPERRADEKMPPGGDRVNDPTEAPAATADIGDDIRGKSPVKPESERAAATVGVASFPYTLQVASLPEPDKANTAVKDFASYGLPVFYAKVDLGKAGTWWRIYLGHFSSQTEAFRARKQHKLSYAMVRKTPYTSLIGVFSAEKEYADITARLRSLGHFPYAVKGADGRFRLYVGAYITLKGARMLESELESQGIQNTIVER